MRGPRSVLIAVVPLLSARASVLGTGSPAGLSPYACRRARPGVARGGALLSTAQPAAPVGSLLAVCKEACDELGEVVRLMYAQLAQDEQTVKADDSVFTIADGLVQHLLQNVLLADDVVGPIVGEEDAVVDLSATPYRVDALEVPSRLSSRIDAAVTRMRSLNDAIPRSAALRECTVFIDPIDGTREFTQRMGQMCSICIGVARAGRPIGGLVYRPMSEPASWAYGCAEEGVAAAQLLSGAGLQSAAHSPAEICKRVPPPRAEPAAGAEGLLMSRGVISPFVLELGEQLGARRVRSGGAGNKALLLLEGAGQSYIQDRGLFRWDTCAGHGVLEAHGGAMGKLTRFAADGVLEPYTYERTDAQLDFEPDVARLTPYNAVGDVPSGAPQLAVRADELKPYANTCGVVALAPAAAASAESRERYRAAITRAAAAHPMDIS